VQKNTQANLYIKLYPHLIILQAVYCILYCLLAEQILPKLPAAGLERIYLPTYLLTYLLVYLFTYLPAYLLTYLFIYLFT